MQPKQHLLATCSVLLMAALLAACAAPAAAPTVTPVPPTPIPDPIAVVQAWFDALNASDLDAALALMTADAKMTGVFTDPMANVLDFWIGLKIKHDVSGCQPEVDQLVCDIIMTDDGCIAASGDSDGLPVQYAFTFQDNKIQGVYVEVVDWENYGRWLGEEGAWASANRAEEYGQTEAFSRESGAMSVKLCQEYADFLEKQVPVVTTAPTVAATSELQTLALAYQDAFNQRDLDAALDLFVDDGLIYVWDGWKPANKQDMRIGLEYVVGKGVKLEITGCAPKGKALGCVLLWRDDYCLKANTGLDVGRYDLTLNSRDGKLSLFSGMRSAELDQAGAASYRKLIDWAEANRPDEWKKVNAPVAYDLSGRPLGELENQLCKAYLESQK